MAKKTNKKTCEQLLTELDETRQRLEETEEILRAIQSGEVDALVVSRPEGEQIFTLQGAEHPYRVLVETMSEGAATLDSEGTIVFCNSRLATMLEVSLEKLIGSTFESYVVPADYHRFATRLRHSDHKRDQEEISLLTGSGNNLPVLISCSAIELSGTRGVGVVLTDISAWKLAEAKILHLNRLYAVLSGTDKAIVHAVDRDSMFRDICRVAVESGGLVMAWIGLVDADSGTITPVACCGSNECLNAGRISMIDGADGGGATGTTIREGGLSIVSDLMKDSRYARHREEADLRGYRSSAAISLKSNDQIIGVLTLYSGEKDFFNSEFADLLLQMGMDISFALDNLESEVRRREAEQALRDQIIERLQITDALREKERLLILQSRQAAMGEMVNNVAHQWRQPLNTLGLTVQQMLLHYDLGDLSREVLDSGVDKSMELIQHMSQTIDDFRNFFRPDREMKPFNVVEKIRTTLALVGDSFKEKSILVEIKAEEEVIANGYQNEFSQVLLNILNNAKDALEERNIEAPLIRIQVFREGTTSVTTISDNAGGIEDSIIDKIFDPYFTTKDSEKGTGIGLYMSKVIIEGHMKGKLSVRNIEQGTEFRIEVGLAWLFELPGKGK